MVPPIDSALRRQTYNGVRLTTGLVFNLGGAPEVPVAAACSIDHNEVLVGEPLHATVAASNFNPNHPLTYTWASSGGKIEGKDTAATIDTTGAAPGTYTATARVVDAKKKKNGEASCTSNFTVKPLNPPQISCTANPGTVEVGTPSTVTCTCTSPDNATVTVGGWTSSAGSVAGSGNSATFTTTGASAGPATISATCTDSRGLTASTTSTVTVNNPPPPPAPVVDKVLEARLALHSVYFVTDKPYATAPNAGMVKSQEEILVALATDFKKYLEAKPDAHLTLEGHADVRGSVPYNQALSERRVARVKGFLIEQGVPEADLETKAFGKQHNLTTAEVKVGGRAEPRADQRGTGQVPAQHAGHQMGEQSPGGRHFERGRPSRDHLGTAVSVQCSRFLDSDRRQGSRQEGRRSQEGRRGTQGPSRKEGRQETNEEAVIAAGRSPQKHNGGSGTASSVFSFAVLQCARALAYFARLGNNPFKTCYATCLRIRDRALAKFPGGGIGFSATGPGGPREGACTSSGRARSQRDRSGRERARAELAGRDGAGKDGTGRDGAGKDRSSGAGSGGDHAGCARQSADPRCGEERAGK